MANKEKIIAANKEWAKNNPKKIMTTWRNWAKNNPDKIKSKRLKYSSVGRERSKAWRDANPELVRSYPLAWDLANPGARRILRSKWRKNNRAKCGALRAKRRAVKLKATPPWLTGYHLRRIEVFYVESNKLTKDTGIRYSVDHIWPLQGKTFSGLHVPWNLRVITLNDNIKKGNKAPVSQYQ